MKLANMPKFATAAIFSASLMVFAIGCDDQTGSPINGGDPVPDRVNPEPPFSQEPGVPEGPTGELGSRPLDETSDGASIEPDLSDSDSASEFRSSPAGSTLEDTDVE